MNEQDRHDSSVDTSADIIEDTTTATRRGLDPAIAAWVQRQRWYAGKGREADFEHLGGFELVDPDSASTLEVLLVLDHAASPLLYQVPVSRRTTADPALEPALIGVAEDGSVLYDGPHDPVFAEALFRLMLDEATARPTDGEPGIAARGHSAPGLPHREIIATRVLGGEQSNTSIIADTTTLDGEPSAPVICKLFRTLHDGENPDVTLLTALAGAGSTSVPRPVGHITGQWRDRGEPTGLAHGHLAFAQEFLPGVEDAWRVALRAATADEDFTARAHALGVATAETHALLASALPTHPATTDDIASVIASFRARFETAATAVPALAVHRAAIETIATRALAAEWPDLQRIHGDFHLGQVLAVPDRGWVLLDFEGEPLRPMHERARVDVTLRDIAGMLRSFDYVAGSISRERGEDHPDAALTAWASAARRAFVDGYIERSGVDLRASRALLDAFEIDKATYEAVYEVGNRPHWLGIPVSAIDRLVARATA